MTLDEFTRHLNDGASLEEVTIALHGSSFDPTPGEPNDEAMSALDLLVFLRCIPKDSLRRMRIRADSGGEFGRMASITKNDISMTFRKDGSGTIEFRSDECAD